MKIHLSVTTTPLDVRAPIFPLSGESGAMVEFYGVVRGWEQEIPLAGLDYEAYRSMAESEFTRIIQALGEKYSVHEVTLTHRLGLVPVGQPSLHVRVTAAHRAEAFQMAQQLIDEMKRSVPIWKHPVRRGD